MRRLAFLLALAFITGACGSTPAPTETPLGATSPIAEVAQLTAPDPTPDLVTRYNECLTGYALSPYVAPEAFATPEPVRFAARIPTDRFVYCGTIYPAVARPRSDILLMEWEDCLAAKAGLVLDAVAKKQCDALLPPR
jgi:hypothetical protein